MKLEASTDLWVYDLLKDAGIKLDPQGSRIKEKNEALKTASKRGTGKVGFPENIGVVNDFIIVIENKASILYHEKLDYRKLISEVQSHVQDYAMNGVLFYGKHLSQNTSFKKIIAIAVSGNEKRHRITPIFIDERGNHRQLADVETFISFNEDNIDEYYIQEILKESTDFEKETSEILKDAASLHEDLRNYGSIQDKDKPLIVSGILLALREIDFSNFNIESLIGDKHKTDGQKVCNSTSLRL